MYQVGFGDCFLVTVNYRTSGTDGRAERHVLFDLGSTRAPGKHAATLGDIAELVAAHTRGHVDVVVITHRHKDHLSGFGDQDSSQTLAALSPTLVLRPWTENPDLANDALAPALRQGHASLRFAAQLSAAQQATAHLANRPAPTLRGWRELHAAATDQQPNEEAIATLDQMAAGRRGRYLHAGSALNLDRIVPGMTVTVLGPPTIEQYPKVAGQVSRDPEYWMLRLQRSLNSAVTQDRAKRSRLTIASPDSQTSRPSDKAPHPGLPPGPVRWMVEHLANHQTHSVTRLVRALDDALNNTSLNLLLEIGGLSMLFPGDAQIENWRYTLDKLDENAELRAKLANIDLYKVGHHGSRNATPRSLHQLWAQRPPDAPRMTALMSTLAGVHGTTPATAVPRATLVEALRQVADLYSTDDLPDDQPFLELVADASGGPFRLANT